MRQDEEKVSERLETIRSYQFNALKDLSVESCQALGDKFANQDFIIPNLKQSQLKELNEALTEFDDEVFNGILSVDSASGSEEKSAEVYDREYFEICSNKSLRTKIIDFLQTHNKQGLVKLINENEGFTQLRARIRYIAPDSCHEVLFNVEEAHHLHLVSKLYKLRQDNKNVASLIKGMTVPILMPIVAPKGGGW